MKLLRLARIKRMLERWEEEISSVGGVKALKVRTLFSLIGQCSIRNRSTYVGGLQIISFCVRHQIIFLVMTTAHWLCCGWFMSGSPDPYNLTNETSKMGWVQVGTQLGQSAEKWPMYSCLPR
jgi:hypothetical protein